MGKLQNIGVEVLEEVKKNLIGGVEIVKKQFPDLVQQLIRWEIITSILWIFVDSLVCILTVWFGFFSYKLIFQKVCDYHSITQSNWWWTGVITSAIMTFILFSCICDCVSKLLKIQIAPKLFLVEYFKKLIQEENKTS